MSHAIVVGGVVGPGQSAHALHRLPRERQGLRVLSLCGQLGGEGEEGVGEAGLMSRPVLFGE
ncbi:hypothetical protein [Streptomyces sp. ME18-1-4]|uniref:hypothetical protein n=1 Tax=Streptomyces sp. ME18-1-4 TaxID=3028685 RepID=UPI0029A9BEC7|nr:hypothetical protein [Streptomyces sp. ME18-1-4]MDX3240365.1 hypothetical protein [Streptomyces sp. ME18-1-4]